MGECPKSCIFLELYGADQFECALARSFLHGASEILSTGLATRKDRYPQTDTCPSQLGFDGRMFTLPENFLK